MAAAGGPALLALNMEQIALHSHFVSVCLLLTMSQQHDPSVAWLTDTT